jgi:NADPH:quinone reductase
MGIRFKRHRAFNGKRIHNIAAQFPVAETAQAHLAVEKGDKLGTVIVDCAR